MKNNLKKFLIINICLICCVILISEITAFVSYRKKYMPSVEKFAKLQNNPAKFLKQNSVRYRMPKNFNYKYIEDTVLSNSYFSEKSQKRPIITIGCSYTYGAFLNREQTFAYKIHEQTGRTTYNRGVCATGPQHVYRQISDKNFKKEIPDAEYVIYTFISHHIIRQVRDLTEEYGSNIELNYVIKQNDLVYKARPFWFMYWSFLVKNYLEYIKVKKYKEEIANGNPLLLKTLEKSVEKMRELYPDSKFVFLMYQEPEKFRDTQFNADKNFIKKLENMGLIFINVYDLVGHDFTESKYWSDDTFHPSENAWNEIVPKLVEELKL